MRRLQLTIWLAVLFAFTQGGILFSASGSQKGQMLERKILALYNRSELTDDSRDISYTLIHENAEMPLNHLGLELVYHNTEETLPSIRSLEEFRGALIWMQSPESFTPELCQWIGDAVESGLKIVLLGELGLVEESPGKIKPISAECRGMYKKMGIEVLGLIEPDPAYLKIVFKDPNMIEFERKLFLREFSEIPLMKLLLNDQRSKLSSLRDPKSAASFLKIRNKEVESEFIQPVFVTTTAALALNPFVLYENREFDPYQKRWRLNPFAFFELAFDVQDWPKPDTTTLNGRRIYYSHIDGDGIFNISEIDNESWSGEIFEKEILLRYPSSPFTVSLITGYYDMRRYNTSPSLQLSRRLLNLPNVEPASHGYAHPLIWNKGSVALPVPGYRFDASQEIVESVKTINHKFLDQGKKANLFLWTGDCLPDRSHLTHIEDQGFLNMNGGDTRFDRWFDSVAYVMPLSRKTGPVRQVYSSNSNENTYTNLWTGPYYGYRDVLETFKNTESPFRIKPVNVYIHFYSAEKIAALKVLKEVYDWAHDQDLFPIYAGDYVKIVDSFFNMQIHRMASNHYRFTENQDIKTIRFDREKRLPDLDRSKGVIGFKRFQGNLYVFLDEGQEHDILLTENLPKTAYLIHSNFKVSQWQVRRDEIRFRKKGWWPGKMALGGLQPDREYEVSTKDQTTNQRTTKSGILSIQFKNSEEGGQSSEVRIVPHL